MEEWLRRPAPGSRCPGPVAILLLLARSLPTLALQAWKLARPLGFPGPGRRPLRLPSFLPPTLIEKAEGGGRPDLNKEREESQEKRKPQPPPGSSRSPSPLPRSARAQRCPPGPGGGARGYEARSMRREANWLGPWASSWRAGRQGAGHSRQPSEARGRLREPAVPAHAGPTASGCAFPGCLGSRPHAGTEGGPRAETHR